MNIFFNIYYILYKYYFLTLLLNQIAYKKGVLYVLL